MNKKIFFSTLFYGVVFSIIFVQLSCDLLYTPKQEPYPNNAVSNVKGLYSINLKQQICNPSISQNQARFPGSMLWLNFSGSLVVNVPDSITPQFNKTNVLQHDRLTITDTSNTVVWFIKRDNLNIPLVDNGHIQDPEWSTHPDYIVCTGYHDGTEWDGFVIRLSDKAVLKFCLRTMGITSTPHLWVPDSAVHGGIVSNPTPDYYDSETGFIKKEYINQFFGTTNVKIAYSMPGANGLTLKYIDYTAADPKPAVMNKPSDKPTWDCQDGLISPDGGWITYNCMKDLYTITSYIQRLKTDDIPVMIADKGSDPHWWLTPSDSTYNIVYTELTGGISVDVELNDSRVESSGSAGITYRQRLKGSPLQGLTVDQGSAAKTLARLPLRGGLSRDGSFLCTGYKYGYIMRLSNYR